MPRKEISTHSSPHKALPIDTEVAIDEFSEFGGYDLSDATARRKMIAEVAYYRAQQRGFEPGHEVEDWLAAENEVVKLWLERAPAASDRR